MRMEVITLDEKTRERYKALGINVRSGTPEEAARFPISMHGGPRSTTLKPNTPTSEEPENSPLSDDPKD